MPAWHDPTPRTSREVEALRTAADRDGRHDAAFTITVTDAEGTTIAEVEKVVYLRGRNTAASHPRSP